MQIDITNHCFMSCLYCSRYNRHLRADQRRHMSLSQVREALESLVDWPGKIGIIGGEPTLHPEFQQICGIIQELIPKEKIGLWTSGRKKYEENLALIDETFGFKAYNEHNALQQETCRHQPLTIAIDEVIPDEALKQVLINDCWVQRTWCPTINHFGAYFCEVAAAQDVLLNDGANAWPVTARWWRKHPEDFKGQKDVFCGNCGMAIPMERELIKNKTQKFSPELLRLFRNKELARVSIDDVEIVEDLFSKEQIAAQAEKWFPGNYRGDLSDDSTAPEGKGFTGKLE